jgi:transposase-like protein
MNKCPECNKEWLEDSEQSACIKVYDKCIVCCVRQEKLNGFEWSLQKVLYKQKELKEKV